MATIFKRIQRRRSQIVPKWQGTIWERLKLMTRLPHLESFICFRSIVSLGAFYRFTQTR